MRVFLDYKKSEQKWYFGWGKIFFFFSEIFKKNKKVEKFES